MVPGNCPREMCPYKSTCKKNDWCVDSWCDANGCGCRFYPCKISVPCEKRRQCPCPPQAVRKYCDGDKNVCATKAKSSCVDWKTKCTSLTPVPKAGWFKFLCPTYGSASQQRACWKRCNKIKGYARTKCTFPCNYLRNYCKQKKFTISGDCSYLWGFIQQCNGYPSTGICPLNMAKWENEWFKRRCVKPKATCGKYALPCFKKCEAKHALYLQKIKAVTKGNSKMYDFLATQSYPFFLSDCKGRCRGNIRWNCPSRTDKTYWKTSWKYFCRMGCFGGHPSGCKSTLANVCK